MGTITIDWTPSHDVGDGEDAIMNSLEAGYDEGPLIVVPWDRGRPGLAGARAGALVLAHAATSHAPCESLSHKERPIRQYLEKKGQRGRQWVPEFKLIAEVPLLG